MKQYLLKMVEQYHYYFSFIINMIEVAFSFEIKIKVNEYKCIQLSDNISSQHYFINALLFSIYEHNFHIHSQFILNYQQFSLFYASF